MNSMEDWIYTNTYEKNELLIKKMHENVEYAVRRLESHIEHNYPFNYVDQLAIEIIRKNIDNTIEELQIKGTELIDGNGIWCFQIPMNLDYVVTDEYGNMVPTDNTDKGIPTRCEVRFRISMDETNPESVNFHRGKVLVPHNPSEESEVDYNFGSYTKDWSFKSLMWNRKVEGYNYRIKAPILGE
jgi:hypothetical protein